MTSARRWDGATQRYLYPLLDEGGNTTGWTHILPARRSDEYTDEPLERQVAKLKQQLWTARQQIEKLKQ